MFDCLCFVGWWDDWWVVGFKLVFLVWFIVLRVSFVGVDGFVVSFGVGFALVVCFVVFTWF